MALQLDACQSLASNAGRDAGRDPEHRALYSACEECVALCTIVGIEGSFSRRLGAQLAIHPGGRITGDLADGCLERQLASDAAIAHVPTLKRYGRGSPNIDFRLPCGGGIDILIDPAPERAACRAAMRALSRREPASLPLPHNDLLQVRKYIPSLHIRAFGEGPELAAFQAISEAAGITAEIYDKQRLSLSHSPDIAPADRWTAVVLLFHDHEWETALLKQAMNSPAFYIGAQGGETARMDRVTRLLCDDVAEEQIARLRGPIGTIPACRSPATLALSILSEIVGEYETLQPTH